MSAKAPVKLDYEPRGQFVAFHQREQRWAALVCHRRAGKTVACVHELVIRACYTSKKNARYAYIAPLYKQAKDVAWQYLKEATKDIAVETRESDLRIILPNGAWITLYGSDNPDALRGIYLDGVVLDEYGDCRPSLWTEVILPTLADRKGWAVFIGTAKGKNHFYHTVEKARLNENWFLMILKASESGLLDQEDLLEFKGMMEPAQYDQEFECDFTAAVKGTYYADVIQTMESDGRIGPEAASYDPSLPVFASMDLGRTDSSAVWFWQEPEGDDFIHVINYWELTQRVAEDFIDYFKNSCPYELETVWVPHDAKAHTFQSRRSTIEQFLDAGIPAKLVPSIKRQQGIDAARLMLQKCRIDTAMCYEGVEALRAYRREYDERTKTYRDNPLHDWASNGADSFRYLSLVARQKGVKIEPSKPADLNKPPEYQLEELFKSNESAQRLSVISRRI